MLIGTFYHTLEGNGRVSLPKTFRDIHQNWIVTRGLDGGLFLYPESAFVQELEKLNSRTFTTKRNRDFVRLMANEATAVTPDKNGRVQLPEYLIQFAKLTKHLVVVGSLSRAEIWDRDAYHAYMLATESQAEQIAESLEATNEQH